MNYFLYKLAFDTAVHFGPTDSALSLYSSEDHFLADTLFSALCHAAVSLYGPEGAEALYAQAEAGQFLLSDGMPWKGDELYLPKPFFYAENRQEVDPKLRKAMKKLTWIPVSAFGAFSASVQGGEPFEAEKYRTHFGEAEEMTKAAVQPGKDTLPYQVGVYRFMPDCGLWFLAGCETEEQALRLRKLTEALGYSGVGGKTSAGYGKFHITACEPLDGNDAQKAWLRASLENETSKTQLLLTTSLPADGELEAVLEGASFQLTRRSGFVQSSAGGVGRKKKTQYFLSAGSVLPVRFRGALYDVGEGGAHAVKRFSSPILLGVTL